MKRHWGYDEFRELQEEVITDVVNGRDTLALMPTGGGKSLTFQVAGLALGGLTIVVTPLVSLMKDQVDNLRKVHIKGAYLRSGMTSREVRATWEKVAHGKCSFLYVSPERLENRRFIDNIRQLPIKLIVVDEAHCISQWGYDFRPPYLRVASLRKLFPKAAVLALTATATPDVAKDICERLEFSGLNIKSRSFVRENISYLVRQPDDKMVELKHILSHTTGSAIVYVRNRRQTDDIASWLNKFGIESASYHAGLLSEHKESRQNAWKDDKTRVMVATNAFGMGIDKADVRVVVHLQMPNSLEEYYQEAGRAGRDGKPSYAVLLASDRDRAILRRHVTESFPDKKIIRKVYERVCNFLNISLEEGAGRMKQFDLEKFCLTFKYNETQVKASLKILQNSGYLFFEEDGEVQSRILFLVSRRDLYDIKVSETAERVMETAMRMYTSLFTEYTVISELKISQTLLIDTALVVEALIELRKAKIIGYIPRSRTPMITLTTPRIEPQHLIIARSAYEERKKVVSARAESMISYTFKDRDCRVARMLRYFGEDNATECGTCDVCRAKRPKREKAKQASSKVTKGEIAKIIARAPGPVAFSQLEKWLGSTNFRSAVAELEADGLVSVKRVFSPGTYPPYYFEIEATSMLRSSYSPDLD